MNDTRNQSMSADDPAAVTDYSMADVLSRLAGRIRLLTIGPVAAGALAFGVASLIPPTYTATTTLLPPQSNQGGASAALASLGSLAGLARGSAGLTTPGDRYVALMQSTTVSDRLIDHFKLTEVYGVGLRTDARKELASSVRIALGKKDGLITIEVDDKSPQRAADIANLYVDELQKLMGRLAVTDAQQRRVFFERQLQQSRDKLAQAQQALQASGFSPGALKAEPKAAAESYARLRAEATAAEVKLQALRGALADNTPEIRQQLATLAALRDQLTRAEQATADGTGPDYVSKYREFKYQEALFELYARQFELARADESREGALIQVVDAAQPPERKSKPRRGVAVLSAVALSALLLGIWVLLRAGRPRAATAAHIPKTQ
jgi:uncharacterized protein involved in exopolysaccharide biosynthesis